MVEQRPRKLIDLLSAALVRRGLRVQVDGDLVTATNPRVLSQGVRLRETPDGLMWCWLWPGPRPADRDTPPPEPEFEPFCPAGDIGQAADLIARVVSGRVEEPADA
ncbi:hypothetical protein NE236_07165 [Actinoallomurus purpureus]|uniref:hypothetical protein n=1 Tax=Actinoallomurus purpureus TaxID=478114 RepID=UPI002093391D|nr:hypothetical protein [Actinoallomurus purpureus]MCO6004754.1 hypothetical protein [Actinoallomurus purpureus]